MAQYISTIINNFVPQVTCSNPAGSMNVCVCVCVCVCRLLSRFIIAVQFHLLLHTDHLINDGNDRSNSDVMNWKSAQYYVGLKMVMKA
jgi:hypothetical protein